MSKINLIAGTSSGAIIGTLLAMRRSPSEVVSQPHKHRSRLGVFKQLSVQVAAEFHKLAPEIFCKRSGLQHPARAQYDDGREEFFKSFTGRALFSDIDPWLLVRLDTLKPRVLFLQQVVMHRNEFVRCADHSLSY